MIMKHIAQIKRNIEIHSNKRTRNILEGSYKSIFKGRSSNFEDLREYVVGDNVKDIDYKASARANKMLIKQYKAEKKHNIMLLLDTGLKMKGDTSKGEKKSEVALMSAGTIAYLASKNGDYIGASFAKDFFPFRLGMGNLEKILSIYEKKVNVSSNITLNEKLTNILKNINRHMIICIITDLEGLDNIEENTLKKCMAAFDMLFININDAYLTGDRGLDLDSNLFIPKMLAFDPKLKELEIAKRQEIFENCQNKLKKYNIELEDIGSKQEIAQKIIKLLERRKNASIS